MWLIQSNSPWWKWVNEEVWFKFLLLLGFFWFFSVTCCNTCVKASFIISRWWKNTLYFMYSTIIAKLKHSFFASWIFIIPHVFLLKVWSPLRHVALRSALKWTETSNFIRAHKITSPMSRASDFSSQATYMIARRAGLRSILVAQLEKSLGTSGLRFCEPWLS